MPVDSVIDEVAREFADFTLEDAIDPQENNPYGNYCDFARLFERWGDELIREYLEHNPDTIRIAQAKVRLIDRYFDWLVSVPKVHRLRMAKNGHICIFHVFERLYQKIRLVELTLVPPPIIITQPPPPPPPPQIAGIVLGEVLGEEN